MPLNFFLLSIMNQSKNLKTRASDESFCSLLVGFNFIFFTGLLAFMLFLPLQAVLSGSDAPLDMERSMMPATKVLQMPATKVL